MISIRAYRKDIVKKKEDFTLRKYSVASNTIPFLVLIYIIEGSAPDNQRISNG